MIHSLRNRVALAAGLLGGLIAIAFSIATWWTSERMEHEFLKQLLWEDLEFLIQEHRKNPNIEPPLLVNLKGYVVPRNELESLPEPVRFLGPGTHELLIAGREHHVALTDHEGLRFVLLYDEDGIEVIEGTLIRFLVVSSFILVLLSTWGGWMAADRIISPVRALSQWVEARGNLEDTGPPPILSRGDDEIRALKTAFEEAFQRVEGFLSREREFTADLSHQLRSPLAVMMSSVELMLAEPGVPEAWRQRLERLAEANSRFAQQIEAVLLLAREPQSDELTPLSVSSTVGHLVEKERSMFSADEQRIELEVADHTTYLPVPAAALDIVVGNLVRNGLFHGTGTVKVRVQPGKVVVQNQGLQIPDEILKRVFERGFTGSDEGSGLGLAIAKRICDRFHWTLSLTSDHTTTTAQLTF